MNFILITSKRIILFPQDYSETAFHKAFINMYYPGSEKNVNIPPRKYKYAGRIRKHFLSVVRGIKEKDMRKGLKAFSL
jgi:hypothetical protein